MRIEKGRDFDPLVSPPFGILKFKVNGATKGKMGLAGIDLQAAGGPIHSHFHYGPQFDSLQPETFQPVQHFNVLFQSFVSLNLKNIYIYI